MTRLRAGTGSRQEPQARDVLQRKRLGQFFTGVGLGRVLAAMADARKATSILDPMAGRGDLLVACLELGARPNTLGAIEIDRSAYASLSELPGVEAVLGSAFDPAIVGTLPRADWDLVIANPPYVRYQAASTAHANIPNAVQVRNGLLATLSRASALSSKDASLFKSLASNYSGLADLAVPSWILCASMVRIGGRLAIVAPEAWLSRDYSAAVQYLLMRAFRIEHIVEDRHAVWFGDALVKTTLLVAKRVRMRCSAYSWRDTNYVSTSISGQAAGAHGPVANLFPDASKPELKLATVARHALRSGRPAVTPLCSVEPRPLSDLASTLSVAASKQHWLATLEHQTPKPIAATPLKLAGLLRVQGKSLVSLGSLGLGIGQGLRTGANRFFYATYLGSEGPHVIVRTDTSRVTLRIPADAVRVVVRRQSDLPRDGLRVRTAALAGRVLTLGNYALPEDMSAGGSLARRCYTPMPAALADYVRSADSEAYVHGGSRKRIRDLTAVSPNIRTGSTDNGVPPRFWYMLPPLVERHTPHLIVPRVLGTRPKTYVLEDEGTVADANFTALWVRGEFPDRYAFLALLNSTWCTACLEATGAVMGGGALKVEATHLRRLPVPILDTASWEKLSVLGKALTSARADVIDQIDLLLLSKLLVARRRNDLRALRQFASEAVAHRSGSADEHSI